MAGESPRSVRLRPWQKAALERFHATAAPDFLAVATPSCAAFGFLGELLPRGEETESMRQIAEGLRSRLSECLETSDDGQLKMTVTLPDASALDNLSRSLAHLLSPR